LGKSRAPLSLIFGVVNVLQSTVVVPQIFVQAVLGCFFESKLESFAG